jgi:predicted enzyme related to lactoylglutathione lyase
VLTINVASVEDALKQVEAGGGTVVRPRTEIPGMGWFAYFKDTEGNTLGLFENAS